MKNRFILYRRKAGGVYYVENTETHKQESLGTRNRAEAMVLLNARNESVRQPQLNLQIAKAYLAGTDSGVSKRTWRDAFNAIIEIKHGSTRERWQCAVRQAAFAVILPLRIIETHAEQLLTCLKTGTVSTNVHLRELHNFCIAMNWLPWPIIPKRLWPRIEYKPKRAITIDEHRRIVGCEPNLDRRRFYELCWHLGGSQTDIANLQAEDIDWNDHVISYARRKTGSRAMIHFGPAVEAVLRLLPASGCLFPRLAPMKEKFRSQYFRHCCRRAGIAGVSLHCYRYSWAERAKQCGYPERFAQEALGHNSKAVHRAYARKAKVLVPSLESYEQHMAEGRIIQLSAVSPEVRQDWQVTR